MQQSSMNKDIIIMNNVSLAGQRFTQMFSDWLHT